MISPLKLTSKLGKLNRVREVGRQLDLMREYVPPLGVDMFAKKSVKLSVCKS